MKNVSCLYLPIKIRLLGRLVAGWHIIRRHGFYSPKYWRGVVEFLTTGFSQSLGVAYVNFELLFIENIPQVDDMKETFLEHVYKIRLDIPHPTIVDIGANNGSSVVYFARQYPTSTIWAYEPGRKAFALMIKNLQHTLTSKGQVHVFQDAVVHNQKQKRSLYIPDPTPTGATLYPSLLDPVRHSTESVSTISFKNMMQQIKKINLLKIDAEGSEYELLPNLVSFSSKIEYLVIELHYKKQINDVGKFYLFLSSLQKNYSLELRQSQNQIYCRREEGGGTIINPDQTNFSIFVYGKSKTYK
jgi:FkbM family methyltransferase